MQFEPLSWDDRPDGPEIEVLRRTRLTALIRAADASLKAPAVKRIATAIGISHDEFLLQWGSPGDMASDLATAVAWQLYDHPLASANSAVRSLAASVLAVERDATVLAERRSQSARDGAWRRALSDGVEHTAGPLSPHAQIALAEIELLSVAAPDYRACLSIQRRLGREDRRYRTALDLVNHVRQSLAVLTDAGPFPHADLAAQVDDFYEAWVDEEGYGMATDALRGWWPVALTPDEWLDDVGAVWSAVVGLTEVASPNAEVSPASGVHALIWALDDALSALEDSHVDAPVDERRREDPATLQPEEESYPDWADAMIPLLAKRWSLSKKPDVRRAFRQRAEQLRYDRAALKYHLVAAAARVVWGARDTPWLPRWDSVSPPIIPSTLTDGEFRTWFARETIKAAESDLLGAPYPLPADGFGRKRHGRDLWESGEADVPEEATSEHADDEGMGETPAWDRQDWESDLAEEPVDRVALAADDLARLRAIASAAVREVIDLYLDLVVKGRASWAEVARRRGVTEGAVRTQVQRLRDRAERLGF